MTTGLPELSAVETGPATRVLLVFPKFNPNSFWSFKEPCELQGNKTSTPPLGLITVAAMLPAHWHVRLIDRNAQELSEADLDAADVVFTGGMLPQEPDAIKVIRMCKARGVPVCVGGPAPTSSPQYYEEADFQVLGEAESVIDEFIAAWERGDRSGRFVAPRFQADVTKTPVPRYDLLDFSNYLYIGLQYSRGCPFTCEFCDIIELYGRKPRTKAAPQVLAELQRLYDLGYRGHVDFVDDNLIGNKKAVKLFLPELIKWQEAHGYPFQFSTEASLNLSDDQDLLNLMRMANFFVVFVGIETPDTDTLNQTQKKQNTRRSIAESVHRIYAAGIFVTAGFIVGFDSEKGSVAQAMAECVRDTAIPSAMVGLLTALPNTQLQRRLEREGRLFSEYSRVSTETGDQCTAGLNYVTSRPRREILEDYRRVLAEVYDPRVFFERVRFVGLALNRPVFAAAKPSWPKIFRDLRSLGRICWRMTLRRPELAGHFWGTFFLILRRNPRALEAAIMNMVLYLHLYPFSHYVIAELDRRIAAIDDGTHFDPPVMPANTQESCATKPLAAVA
ncbi:B12-binding domain-containing radical SAM protein [Methylobacterium haplocladii]|uniref:B12-binding domain-containing radical SAM protein n=1 Tax=Methylobacterium haplocladii TaxID=1176176 RepID=A0A512INY0_9HYPH|nr:radical SAM protein [Methylobacterium haplocladii]GEO99407.1 B12-binding domain-containing radical SAM protein [Methylobacterium haplocladii]GJD83235.1 Hopanoid C-2 methylase [Methylobacterium haplocladii]GLS60629.1 B12-binding domain-containing radical SAM protein [Methylobacterium haplocladii]